MGPRVHENMIRQLQEGVTLQGIQYGPVDCQLLTKGTDQVLSRPGNPQEQRRQHLQLTLREGKVWRGGLGLCAYLMSCGTHSVTSCLA